VGWSLPILTYHAVAGATRTSPLAVPPRRFAAHMAALAEAGYQAVPMARVAEALGSPTAARLPARAVAITFDDGYRSVLEEALPILRAHGFSATVYLIAGTELPLSWRPEWPLLTWAEAERLAAAGFELGAHTVSHPPLTRVPLGVAERELVESQATIQQRTGQPARSLAYPYGARSAAVEALARRHFDAACGTMLGLAGSASNRYNLERVDAHYLNPARITASLPALPVRGYLLARRALRWARRLARPDWMDRMAPRQPAGPPRL
jgi:peptidoglycan/xylan/chitin deacetylase (PgdA/CDA1 family)